MQDLRRALKDRTFWVLFPVVLHFMIDVDLYLCHRTMHSVRRRIFGRRTKLVTQIDPRLYERSIGSKINQRSQSEIRFQFFPSFLLIFLVVVFAQSLLFLPSSYHPPLAFTHYLFAAFHRQSLGPSDKALTVVQRNNKRSGCGFAFNL